MKKSKNIIIKYTSVLLIGVLIISFFSGCKKLVEADGPATSLPDKEIFNRDATAIGAVTTLYAILSGAWMQYDHQLTTLSAIAGISADEMVYYGSGDGLMGAYYQNNLNSIIVDFMDYWTMIYKSMYQINAALEGIEASSGLTPVVKQQLLGEARFMRAFCYFYLVNLYGDVPLILGTDYTANTLAKKATQQKVYEQIVDDLNEAQSLLSDKFLTADLINAYPAGMEERVRPTKWAATALLARTYLYMKDWVNAEKQASLLLDNNSQFELETLNTAFIKNNREAIWQLQPVTIGYNTMEAYTFVLTEYGPNWEQPFYLSDDLLNTFSTDDLRKTQWINHTTIDGDTYYYPYKYKINIYDAPVNEYSTVMRLGEQYLIRAEARAQQNNLTGAIDDVDKIRNRAGLPLIEDTDPGIEQAGLLTAVLTERQHELFSEWGHRWFDLKRTGKIDEVMELALPEKRAGAEWKKYMQWFPIYFVELENNPNLEQVDGY